MEGLRTRIPITAKTKQEIALDEKLLINIAKSLAILTKKFLKYSSSYNISANYYNNVISKSKSDSLVLNKINITKEESFTLLQNANNNMTACQCAINDASIALNAAIAASSGYTYLMPQYTFITGKTPTELAARIPNLTMSDFTNYTIISNAQLALLALNAGYNYLTILPNFIDNVSNIKTTDPLITSTDAYKNKNNYDKNNISAAIKLDTISCPTYVKPLVGNLDSIDILANMALKSALDNYNGVPPAK